MPSFAVVVAIGLNHAHVFVLDPTLAAGSSDHPQEHRRPCLEIVPAIISETFSDSLGHFDQLCCKNCPYVLALRRTPASVYQALNRRDIQEEGKHALGAGFCGGWRSASACVLGRHSTPPEKLTMRRNRLRQTHRELRGLCYYGNHPDLDWVCSHELAHAEPAVRHAEAILTRPHHDSTAEIVLK
jgi:hypothetical protein